MGEISAAAPSWAAPARSSLMRPEAEVTQSVINEWHRDKPLARARHLTVQLKTSKAVAFNRQKIIYFARDRAPEPRIVVDAPETIRLREFEQTISLFSGNAMPANKATSSACRETPPYQKPP